MKNFATVQPFTVIPGHAEWLKLTERRTNLGLFSIGHRRTNTRLITIDNLVERFEMHKEEMIPLHYAIARACCAWLIDKEGRRSVRREAVMKLLKTVLANLEKLGLEEFGISNTSRTWAQIDTYLKGARVRSAFRQLMAGHKIRSRQGRTLEAFRRSRQGSQPSTPLPAGGWGRAMKAVRRLGSSSGGAQRLQSGFWRETVPLAGPANTPLHDARKSHRHVHLLGGQGLAGKREDENHKAAAERLLREAGGGTIKASAGGGAMNVWYFDDEDRYMHMLDLGSDSIRMRDSDGELQILNTVTKQKGFQKPGFLYAADMAGNIFAAEDEDAGDLQLRHSCFLEGSSVLCAGLITVIKGKLIYIDNDSGHYQPSYENLYRLVSQLAACGVDLSQTRVNPHGVNQMPAKIFLARGWFGGHRTRSGETMSAEGYIIRGMGARGEYKFKTLMLPNGRDVIQYKSSKAEWEDPWVDMPAGTYDLKRELTSDKMFRARVKAHGAFALIN